MRFCVTLLLNYLVSFILEKQRHVVHDVADANKARLQPMAFINCHCSLYGVQIVLARDHPWVSCDLSIKCNWIHIKVVESKNDLLGNALHILFFSNSINQANYTSGVRFTKVFRTEFGHKYILVECSVIALCLPVMSKITRYKLVCYK